MRGVLERFNGARKYSFELFKVQREAEWTLSHTFLFDMRCASNKDLSTFSTFRTSSTSPFVGQGRLGNLSKSQIPHAAVVQGPKDLPKARKERQKE